MFEFIESFLAEIALSITIVCFFFSFLYKGKKWKLSSVAFLVVISPFYLGRSNLPQWTLISAWLVLIPLGALLLFKNVKICAYCLTLNPLRQDAEHKQRGKRKLSLTLKGLEKLNEVFLTAIVGLVLVVFAQKSLELFQVPLFLAGLVVLIALAVFFFVNEKDTPVRKLRINVLTFLLSSYVIMIYGFLDLLFFLNANFSIGLLKSSIIGGFVLGVFYMIVEEVLLRVETSDISSEGPLAARFARYFKLNLTVSVLLLLLLSDTPMVLGMLLEENTGTMLQWTWPFICFIAGLSVNAWQHTLSFKMRANLIDQAELEEELAKLSAHPSRR